MEIYAFLNQFYHVSHFSVLVETENSVLLIWANLLLSLALLLKFTEPDLLMIHGILLSLKYLIIYSRAEKHHNT